MVSVQSGGVTNPLQANSMGSLQTIFARIKSEFHDREGSPWTWSRQRYTETVAPHMVNGLLSSVSGPGTRKCSWICLTGPIAWNGSTVSVFREAKYNESDEAASCVTLGRGNNGLMFHSDLWHAKYSRQFRIIFINAQHERGNQSSVWFKIKLRCENVNVYLAHAMLWGGIRRQSQAGFANYFRPRVCAFGVLVFLGPLLLNQLGTLASWTAVHRFRFCVGCPLVN